MTVTPRPPPDVVQPACHKASTARADRKKSRSTVGRIDTGCAARGATWPSSREGWTKRALRPYHQEATTLMSSPEFERFLNDLCRSLKLRRSQRAAIREELEDHFESCVDDLIAEGMSRADAVREAVREFGDAVDLAQRFGRIGRERTWIMRSALAASIVAASAVVTSFLIPTDTRNVFAPQGVVADEAQDRASPAGPRGRTAGMAVRVDPETDRPVNARIRVRLAETVPELAYSDAPLEAALEQFAELAGVNVHVAWPALEANGVERDTPVKLKLRDVSLGDALQLLLELAGGSDGELAFWIQGGVLRISTRDDMSRRTVVTLYDCRDIVSVSLTRSERRELEEALAVWSLHETVSEAKEQAGTVSAAVKGPQQPHRNAELVDTIERIMRDRRMQELCNAIQTTIDGDSWRENGGNVGCIAVVGTTLVVTHTPAVHEQIELLLKRLMEIQPAAMAAPTAR